MRKGTGSAAPGRHRGRALRTRGRPTPSPGPRRPESPRRGGRAQRPPSPARLGGCRAECAGRRARDNGAARGRPLRGALSPRASGPRRPPPECAEYALSLPDSNEPITRAAAGVGGAAAGQRALRTLGGAGGFSDFKHRRGAAGHSPRPTRWGPGESRRHCPFYGGLPAPFSAAPRARGRVE